jgi:hypothetical protein
LGLVIFPVSFLAYYYTFLALPLKDVDILPPKFQELLEFSLKDQLQIDNFPQKDYFKERWAMFCRNIALSLGNTNYRP